MILRKTKVEYISKTRQHNIYHLLFMDDLSIYGNIIHQITSLVDQVYTLNVYIRRNFKLKLCASLHLKREVKL